MAGDGFGALVVGVDELGGGGEGAQGGVVDDLFNCVVEGVVVGVAAGLGLGQVEARNLEAVEEEAGAAGVDGVGGEAAEDLADTGLDSGAVLGEGEVEGGGGG